jgi:hypothetical protein
MENKCAQCGKPIINGHVIAKIDYVKRFFCNEKPAFWVKTCVGKFLEQHPAQYNFEFERIVQ